MLQRRLFCRAIVIGLSSVLVLVGGMSMAQQDIYYSSGAFSFHYEQTFPGPYGGDFSAEGPDLNLFGEFRPGQTEAVGGELFHDADDTTSAVAYAMVDNQDGTVDAAILLVRAVGEVTPGAYPIDTEDYMAQFAFIDDIEDFDLPVDPDFDELLAWILQATAAYKFFGLSGTIVITEVDDNGFNGSFGGVMIDLVEVFMIDIEDGVFDLNPAGPVAVPVLGAGVRLTVGPNPFNPQTHVKLHLPASELVTVTVHDLAGRNVRLLHKGPLATGDHHWVWDGREVSGTRVAAGVYLVRANGPSWQQTTKAVLLP